MDNLNGIRKEFMQSAGFRMLLDEALAMYPKPQPFRPNDPEEAQVNEWKSKSSEKAGFDLCFKMMTGLTPEEFKE